MKSALFISPRAADHKALCDIFARRKWTLYSASNFAEAVEVLESRPVPVVLVERDLPLGTWQDALALLQQNDPAPRVIVVSRVADDRFWSEVLNRGGQDVLATPFHESEVKWALESAWETLGQHAEPPPAQRMCQGA